MWTEYVLIKIKMTKNYALRIKTTQNIKGTFFHIRQWSSFKDYNGKRLLLFRKSKKNRKQPV